jgi:hypothetical protein
VVLYHAQLFKDAHDDHGARDRDRKRKEEAVKECKAHRLPHDVSEGEGPKRLDHRNDERLFADRAQLGYGVFQSDYEQQKDDADFCQQVHYFWMRDERKRRSVRPYKHPCRNVAYHHWLLYLVKHERHDGCDDHYYCKILYHRSCFSHHLQSFCSNSLKVYTRLSRVEKAVTPKACV